MNKRSLGIIAGLLLGACDDGESNSKFSTGLDPAKTPASLSPADRAALCTKVASFVPSMMTKADSCKFAGVMGAALGSMGGGDMKALCTASYDSCMNEPADTTDTPADTAECSQGMGTCTATVAEIESCMNDTAASMRTMMAKIPSCSQVTASSLTSLTTSTPSTEMPASCAALEAKCPDMGTDTASSP